MVFFYHRIMTAYTLPAMPPAASGTNAAHRRYWHHAGKVLGESLMSSQHRVAAGKRVLVVEDELMIRMLLEGMLTDLGHTVTAETGRIEEALALAKQGEFDLAVLDVNLNNRPVTPVAEILARRGVPFVFASGYDQSAVPEAYRHNPTLQKPFQAEALARAIDAAIAKVAN
jgi:CheY-like chemotaxis protein